MMIYSPRLENYQFSPASLDIIDIRQHYISILYKSKNYETDTKLTVTMKTGKQA